MFDGREAAAADALKDAGDEHDVEAGGDAAEEGSDGEEGDAGHVVIFSAEDAGEPGGHGEDDGIGDEVGGEDPGDLVVGAAETAGDVGERDIGDGGVEQLHEGGEGDGEGDDPRVNGGAGWPGSGFNWWRWRDFGWLYECRGRHWGVGSPL